MPHPDVEVGESHSYVHKPVGGIEIISCTQDKRGYFHIKYKNGKTTKSTVAPKTSGISCDDSGSIKHWLNVSGD